VYVRAKNSVGSSAWSTVKKGTPVLPNPPAAPSISTVTGEFETLVVTWPTVTGAESYEVFVIDTATVPAAATAATTTGVTISGTTAIIAGLDNGTSYNVYVRAVNAGGKSAWSAVASEAPVAKVPLKPVISTVTAGNAALTVTWGAAVGATTYDVYVDTGASMPGSAAQSGLTATTTTVTGLTNGSLYNVWVEAKNTAGNTASDPQKGAPWDLTLMAGFEGIWDTRLDSYVFSNSGLTVQYSDGYPDTSAWASDYTATVKYALEYTPGQSNSGDGNGVIIVEYTSPPSSPFTGGTSNFEAIYFKRRETMSDGSLPVRFANAYDVPGNTDIPDLAEAIAFYTQANESTLVSNWNSITNAYQEPSWVTPLTMGALEGNWTGDDDGLYGSTYMKISDHRLTVFMAALAPNAIQYSGAIVERTDPSADTGYIYIRLNRGGERGRIGTILDAVADD
jgi:hypothetical protein